MATGSDVGARHRQAGGAVGSGESPGAGSAEPGGDSGGADRSVSVWTVLLFLLGCALLVVAAMNLMNLGPWAAEYGQVLVFLGFFLVMSIAGRWFWGGIDAMVAAVRGSKDG